MERRVALFLCSACATTALCLGLLGCDAKSLLGAIEADVQEALSPRSFTLTIEVDPAGAGATDPTGKVSVSKDKPITIQATPDVSADWAGWTVKSGAGAGFGDSSSQSTTVTLTEADATITAKFTLVHRNLTMAGTNCTVTPSGTTSVLRGKDSSIRCTPDANYYFTGWMANPPGNAAFGNAALASTTVVLTGDAAVSASCTNITRSLTVNHSGSGSTSPSGTTSVPQGFAQGISATPGNGYSFAGWSVVSGAGVSIADPSSATTTASLSSEDGTISASFVVTPAIQTASPASGSTVSVSQAITLSFNKSMNPATLTVGGTLVAPGYSATWPDASTLRVSPQSAWTGGSKSLSISCRDTDGVGAAGDFTYTVDATAPTISSINYAANSPITKTTSLVLTFSEAIAQSSPVPSLGGTLLAGGYSAAWSNGNKTLTVSPVTAWTVGSWLTLSISCSDPYQNAFSTTLSYGVLDGIVYVKTSTDGGNDSNPGTQAHPKATIQAAIDLADVFYADAEVHVAEGTFDVSSGTTYVVVKEGVDLYGGYDKTNWAVKGRTTTIRDLKTTGGSQAGPNCAVYAGAGISVSTKIDGFTVRGGSAAWTAGIYCYGGSPTISNNSVYGGLDCTGAAVGVYCYYNAAPTIGPGNTISGGTSSANYEDQCPMGVYFWDNCTPTIIGNNISGGGGGTTKYTTGIYAWTSTAVIARNSITGGTATTSSTGIDYRYGYASVGSIRNNTIVGGTSATTYGVFIYDSTPDVRNNTINGGSASASSYSILINSGSTVYHPNVENNHIFTVSGTNRYGVQVYNTCTPNRLYNNNIFDCTSLYIGGGTNCTTIAQVNALAFTGGSDISEDISAYLNAEYRFTGNTASYGFDSAGLDGAARSWGFTDDKDGIARTGNGTTGWSIGAYEYN
jgi:hypothetical protein